MKARRLLGALGALALVAAVVLLALRFGWFDTATAPVILPDTTALPTAAGEGGIGGATLAEVTPETVQAVVRTLARPDSYSRRLLVSSYWEDGGQSWLIQVWQKNEATRIRLTSPETGDADKNCLLRDGELCIWYGDGPEVFRSEAAQQLSADILQMIPSYEDLLQADPAQIEDAGYVNLYGTWRIMAAVREKPTDYLMVYYISIDTGLLEAAERRDGDKVIYRLTSEQADLAAPGDEMFLLPGEELTNS